ncbi:exosporium glycoprotein BclB-related protein [Lysinibacillus sp. NPDC093688]|uniref:exosporium glycoprotein BclB-related protein n=1 Tax=Lysinibacillus sp. NPDC093688 TaxID=3390577 RepID=UPI003D07F679
MHSGTFNNCGCHDSQHHNCNQVEHMKKNCFTRPILAIDKDCIPPQQEPTPLESRIAFSSGGYPATLKTAITGLPSEVSQVGFGTAINTIATNPLNLISNEAFTVSKNGFITSIAATFVLENQADFQTSQSIISATIYKAAKGSNDFFATAATVVLTPTLTGLKPAGAIVSGSAQVNVPIAVEERLVMVFSLNQTNLPAGFLGGTIVGFESAGITIM